MIILFVYVALENALGCAERNDSVTISLSRYNNYLIGDISWLQLCLTLIVNIGGIYIYRSNRFDGIVIFR